MPFADLVPAPWRALLADPLIAYPAAAALLLAIVALAGGVARGDFRVLEHGRAWLAVSLAVVASLGLALVDERLASAALQGADALGGSPDASAANGSGPAGEPEWWAHAAGLRRLPLYLLALGYGPTVGMVVAVLFVAVEATLAPIPGGELVLVLECAVVGWLGLAPSPFRHRWAAPFDVLLGWLLAWATAGTALLAARHVPLAFDTLLDAAAASAGGVAIAALLLALPSPAAWRALFPDSLVAPADEDPNRTIEPLQAEAPSRRLDGERWPAPPRWSRRRRPPRRKR